MSISETLVLPGQPTTGNTVFEALGGDGLTAPHSAWHVNGFELTGDVTGGTVTMTVRMDPRFVSLVGHMTLRSTQVNDADKIVRWTCSGGTRLPRVGATRTLTHAPYLSSNELFDTYVPPPVLLPGGSTSACSIILENDTNNLYLMDALIYLFNIDVRQKYPSGPLLWARGVGQGV